MTNETYDVVVVGAGAAGLSGAVALGRSRRSVLVIDAGQPRNAPAGHVHNYLTRDGIPPAELLAAGRAEVTAYGGAFVDGTVVAATPVDDGFRVTLADGREVGARRLLVTTGLLDELPDVAGVAERWGSTVLHCPYCHGWEVRDRAVGVLATGPMAVLQALMWRQWTADVTLFLHTTPPPGPDEAERLAVRGITVVAGVVAALEDEGVRLGSGELAARDAFVVQTRLTARSDVLTSLGVKPVDMEVDGQVIGSYVPADPAGTTDVPGVWVAGNVTDLTAQVVSSAAAGVKAAAAINADLVEADTRAAVAAHRARTADAHAHGHEHGGDVMRMFTEEAWEERYRSRDAVWSGRPNPQLLAEASDLSPGTALDVGSGEGADALWLADRGWQVTGVDFSATALARAAAHAAERGATVEWVHADVTAWTPPERTFDLVSAQFMHLPPAPRRELFGRLAAAVRAGGTLLIVGHHPDDMRTSMPRPDLPDRFFTAEEVAATLAPQEWEAIRAEARSRTARDPDGRDVTIQDAVLIARRR